jgi:hypothetical protein
VDKVRVKDNTRDQFQIRLTTVDGTITCVVLVPDPERQTLLSQRRSVALQLAKRLARRLDSEIKEMPASALTRSPGIAPT